MKPSLPGTQSTDSLLKVALLFLPTTLLGTFRGAKRERQTSEDSQHTHATSVQQAAGLLPAHSPSTSHAAQPRALSHPTMLCTWDPCVQRPQDQVTSPLAPSHSQAQLLWQCGAC